MPSFIHEDFLLHGKTARRLYHEFARRFGLGTIDSGNTPESVSFAQAAEYFGLS